MADWKVQYLNALKTRDDRQKALADIYDRCMSWLLWSGGMR